MAQEYRFLHDDRIITGKNDYFGGDHGIEVSEKTAHLYSTDFHLQPSTYFTCLITKTTAVVQGHTGITTRNEA